MRDRAPVQGWAAGIPWELHLEAYSAYCKAYGPQLALIEGNCRGGFHTEELDLFIPGWRDRASVFQELQLRYGRLVFAVQELLDLTDLSCMQANEEISLSERCPCTVCVLRRLVE